MEKTRRRKQIFIEKTRPGSSYLSGEGHAPRHFTPSTFRSRQILSICGFEFVFSAFCLLKMTLSDARVRCPRLLYNRLFTSSSLKMKWIGRLSIDIRFLFFFFLFYVLLMWKRSNIRLLCFFDWKISSTIYIIVRTYIDNRAIFIFQWKKGNAKKVKRERFIVDVCYNQPITSMNEDVHEMMCGRYETRVFRY